MLCVKLTDDGALYLYMYCFDWPSVVVGELLHDLAVNLISKLRML